MRFGSVCSGIEAASVAWHPLGWQAAWFSEIEPFPCAVLAHHYPEVPNHGDMTALPARIRSGEVEAPDLFCGGTPCQAFSVAGLRRSLDDERGNLSLTFVEIADAIDDVRRARGDAECIVFWENVPGVLSTQDNAFGCFLGALAGCDTAIEPLAATGWTDAGVVAGPVRTVAWRVLDAQYFGLAQRRRRVFVVASAREGFDPAAVLLEWEGVRRDSAPSREAREAVTPTIDASFGRLQGCSGQDANHGHGHLITEAFGGNRTSGSIDITPALLAQPGSGWKGDFESETFLVQPTHTLRSEGFDASEDGTGRGTPLVPVAFDTYNQTISETAQTLCSRGDTPGGNAHLVPAVLAHAFDARQSDVIQYGDKTGPLDTDGHSVAVAVRTANTSANGHGISAELAHTLDQAQGQAVAIGFDSYNQMLTGDITQTIGTSLELNPKVLAPTLTATNDPSRSQQSSEVTAQVAAVVQATAVAFTQNSRSEVREIGGDGQIVGALAADSGAQQQNYVAQAVAALFIQDDTTPKVNEERAGCLRRDAGGEGACVMTPAMQVRRLTPVECERLQGFPDHYTAIPWRNKPASECPDGPRYKALGNSWAVPCVRWIGRRIAAQIA